MDALLIIEAAGMIISTFMGAIGSLLIKKGVKSTGDDVWSYLLNFRLVSGLAIFALSAFIYIILLKFADLSLLYPVTSLSYIWVIFLSKKFLGERINAYKISGIALIMLGIIFITSL
ncbi:EamA family transporter [Candidatus Woesearchaeota archaeon]|nr:EamA family transporter [Candidatus Woesearchaeota archaeon]